MVKAVAPNATILVYEGTDPVSIYSKIASDNTAQQVSTSWYDGTDSGTNAPSQSVTTGENIAFEQMASQGQSLYGATGDYGDMVKVGGTQQNPVLVFGVQNVTSNPYITAVGGTNLTLDATTGAYSSETAWTGDTAGGSTGGVSTVWSLPIYQSLLVSPGSNGSSSKRNLPDVSLDSDPNSGYSIYRTSGYPTKAGSWIYGEGGTSAAAPLWAGFNALVNQNRFSQGAGVIGFINNALYYLGNAREASDYHDITVGNNGAYPAVAGYDNVTGWGTFNGGAMFNDLAKNFVTEWVDGSYQGSTSNGLQSTPYKKVVDALNGAPANALTLIYVRGSAYNETFNTTKSVVFVNNGNGHATLGSGTVH